MKKIYIILAVALLLSACQTKEQIGVILPFSGDLAVFGEDIAKGIRLYQPTNVEFIFEDGGSQPADALDAYLSLEAKDIDYYLGPFGPAQSQVLSSYADVFIAMSMCAEDFALYETMSCIYPSPAFQVEQALIFPRHRGLTTFSAILSHDAQGEYFENLLPERAVIHGLKLHTVLLYNEQDKDLASIATKAMVSNPEFIVITSALPSAGFSLIESLKEQGYEGDIYAWTNINDATAEEFADVLEDVYVAGSAKLTYDESFVQDFISVYGEDPNLYNALGYMFAEVYDQLDSFTKTDLQHFVNTNEFAVEGFMYENNDVHFPMEMLQVRNGKLEVVG